MISNVTFNTMIITPKIIITLTTKPMQNIKLPRGIKKRKHLNKRASKKKN